MADPRANDPPRPNPPKPAVKTKRELVLDAFFAAGGSLRGHAPLRFRVTLPNAWPHTMNTLKVFVENLGAAVTFNGTTATLRGSVELDAVAWAVSETFGYPVEET